MINVIGASFTAEYFIKGMYETTIGAATAWWSSDGTWKASTREDRFIQEVASDYSIFIHATPWYEYPFGPKLKQLWNLPGPAKGSWIRRWERRLEFTVELLFKTAWGWVIKQGTQASYDPEAMTIQALAVEGSNQLDGIDPAIKVLGRFSDHSVLLSLPRYEPFKQAVETLIKQDVRLVEVAGNERILITVIVPKDWEYVTGPGSKVCEWRILSDPGQKRVALLVPIGELHKTLPALKRNGIILDHLYDF